MTFQEKEIIREELFKQIKALNISQSEAAKRIGVSGATITHIKQGKYENITDAWLLINRWVFPNKSHDWNAAKTRNFKRIQNICNDAQKQGYTRVISAGRGLGKSFSLEEYSKENENVFYVEANTDMSKKEFFQAICRVMGLEQTGTKGNLLLSIIDKLNKIYKPLLIIDEFEKMQNKAMIGFNDIVNKCKQKGFVLCGGLRLKREIVKGVKNQWKAFDELESRMGGEDKILTMYNIILSDVEVICNRNGITDKATIKSIYAGNIQQNIAGCNNDLRRVHTRIKELKFIQSQ